MEDDKLAAYYDELTRKGGGAARFKQGLGFSSTASPPNDSVPARGSALPTASSFLSGFVKASSPSRTSEFEKQAQLQSIQNKLSKKPTDNSRGRSPSRVSSRRSGSRSQSPSRHRKSDRHSKRRSRTRSRSKDRYSRRRSKSRSRSRSRDRHSRRRSRSRSRDRRSSRRSRSRENESRRRYHSRSRSRDRNRERSKRKGSPDELKRGKSQNGGGVDYTKLIEGYDTMTPAERVKAKMKLQLSRTAENDETIGKGSGWERFDFDKDAPLNDEEIEAADDDAVLVKHVGQSFRFSAVEARKEADIQAAHDEAMFGASSVQSLTETANDEETDRTRKENNADTAPAETLLNEQVLTMQKGSWRDRVRKA